MLVSELRELLSKYKEKELRLLIVEMYKAMPKKIREEKEIDKLLQDVHEFLSVGKAKKKQEQVDIDLLKPEIEEFIDTSSIVILGILLISCRYRASNFHIWNYSR